MIFFDAQNGRYLRKMLQHGLLLQSKWTSVAATVLSSGHGCLSVSFIHSNPKGKQPPESPANTSRAAATGAPVARAAFAGGGRQQPRADGPRSLCAGWRRRARPARTQPSPSPLPGGLRGHPNSGGRRRVNRWLSLN